MDSPDRPRTRPDDVACSVCREPVAPERTRLLARRDDLLFLELRCRTCASVTLGFVFAPDDRLLPDTIRLAGAPAIGADDVLDMHRHLEAWDGDLQSLLDHGGRGR
jgi:hypothetical protein